MRPLKIFRWKNKVQNAVHFIFNWELKNDALFLSPTLLSGSSNQDGIFTLAGLTDVDGAREITQQELNTNEESTENFLLKSRAPSTPVGARLGPAL